MYMCTYQIPFHIFYWTHNEIKLGKNPTLICKVCSSSINVFWKKNSSIFSKKLMLCQPLRQTIVQSITVFLSFSSLRDVWFSDSVHKFSPQSTNQKIIMLYWHRCYWGVSNAWKIFAKKPRILKNPFCYYGTIARNTTTHFFHNHICSFWVKR